MAFLPETIVSALLEPVIDTLTAALTAEYHLRRDVPKEVRKLNLTLSMIASFLEDAEDKQIRDKAVHKWLGELKQVILDADDVLDEYATRLALKSRGDDESSRPINSIQRKVWKTLNPCITCSNMLPDILTSGDIAHSMRDIRERLEDINKNRSSLGLQVSTATRHFEITTQSRRRQDTTSVLADESSILGREEEKQSILQLLLSSPNEAESSSTQRNVSVLPIVGMGGVGKTTLAQLVFNDNTIKEHFPLRMWVCISDDFNVERVTKEIIESSSKSNQDPDALTNLGPMTNLDAIQHRLKNWCHLTHLVAEESLISNVEGIGNLTSLQELVSFDAYKHKIVEIKGMNQLCELSIKRLDCVKGKEEARLVEMNGKTHLKKLKLGWSIENRDVNTQNCKLDEEVLESLQPNPDLLKDLSITGYAGMRFPSWLTVNQSSSFLETIYLEDCREVTFLPPIGQLPFLKYLAISGMRGIKHVGHEFYGSGRVMKKAFPLLENLRFQNMPEWEVWKGAEEEGQSLFFPCLLRLEVIDCPKLMELPPLPPSVSELRMENLGVTVLPGLQGTRSSTATTTSQTALLSSSLAHLTIVKCSNLKELNNNNNNIAAFDEGLLLYMCLQQLTSISDLKINGCQSLTSLPGDVLRHLTSLDSLYISNCQQLTSLELQPLTSLRYLTLEDCPKLMVTTSSSSLPSSSSPSPLYYLSISNCSNLITTGELLQSLPSLEHLDIINYKNLQSLPTELGSLSSLKVLRIFDCPQIQSLPDRERLPTSLHSLRIDECPTLKKRCQRERGPDWHKISHIPNIIID